MEKLDRIKELVALLNKAGKSYYSEGQEIMSNYEYDALYDELGMPKTLKETGIPEEEFFANLPQYIEMVKEIGHIYWIAGFKGDDSLEGLYRMSYYGLKEE